MGSSKISLTMSFVCALTLMASLLFPVEVTAQSGSGTARFRINVLSDFLRLENVKRGDTVSGLTVVSDSQLSENMRRIVEIADGVSEHENVAVLVLANRNGVVYERYKYGTRSNTHLLGYSMTKGITSMVVGKALCSGHLEDINDMAEDYVPELAGSAYGATSIRNLLTMSSGVLNNFDKYQASDMRLLAYKEYSAEDLENLRYPEIKKYLLASDERRSIASYLSSFESRAFEAGERYLYSGQDTDALGLIVARSTGMSLVEYASKEIWQEIGAEGDAKWMVDLNGDAFARAGFYAQSHDWIRLGRYILESMQGRSEDICFRNYMIEATNRQINIPWGDEGYGYQFQTEISQLEHNTIQLQGLGGQRLIMEPVTGTVVYMFSGGRSYHWIDGSGFYDLVNRFIELSPENE